LTLLLTTLLHTCSFLSPLFNLILNVPLALVWVVGFALLTWNTLGLLTHSCTKVNWESGDGMMICRCYKANYSFVIMGMLSHIAMVIVDIRARRNQTALGRYAQMDKAKNEKEENDAAWSSATPGHERVASYHDDVNANVPYGVDVDSRRPKTMAPAAAIGAREHSPYQSMGTNGREEYGLRDFGYQAPVQQTTYDSGNYYQSYQR
jgi:hypothetical protein